MFTIVNALEQFFTWHMLPICWGNPALAVTQGQQMEQTQQGPEECARTGEAVIVVDEYGVRHPGLVTNGWGGNSPFPAINVTFVVSDHKKRDQYGTQKDHLCSTSHARYQSAPGRYWYKDSRWARPTERDGVQMHADSVQAEVDEFNRRAEANKR